MVGIVYISSNRDTTTYPDTSLPVIFDQNLEKALCPICVDRERTTMLRYGTRTHTVLVIGSEGDAYYTEVDRYAVDSVKGEDGLGVIKKGDVRRDTSFAVNL